MTGAWLFMLKCIYVIYIHLCVNCERQWSPVVNSVESVVRLPELKSWFCSFDTCKLREVSESSSARDPASVTRGCPSHFSHAYIKWSACCRWAPVGVCCCYSACGYFCMLLIFHNNNHHKILSGKKWSYPVSLELFGIVTLLRCTGIDGAAIKDYLNLNVFSPVEVLVLICVLYPAY